jgi:hypothetical protein
MGGVPRSKIFKQAVIYLRSKAAKGAEVIYLKMPGAARVAL